MLTKEGKLDLSKRLYTLLALLTLGVLTFWGFRVYEIWRNAHGLYPREISIEAQGKAFVTPDVAEMTIGVHTEGEKTDKVVKDNTEKMNKVIAEMKKLGIEEKDIQTTSYYMNPKYAWIEGQGDVQKGYTIDQTIVVKIRDLTKAGDAVAKATEAGANTLSGIQFKVDDTEKAKEVAREIAIKNAKEKAKVIAKQTGLKLGDVVSYYEYMNDPYVSGYGMGGPMYAKSEDAGVGGGSAVPDTQAGQQEITLSVTLNYRVY